LIFHAVSRMISDQVEQMMLELQLDVEDVYALCEAVSCAKQQLTMRRGTQ
jgi:hypothetical protein